MLQTLRLYWDILWRRRGPAEVPYSPALCVATAVAFVLVNLGLQALGDRLAPPAQNAPRLDVPPVMFVVIVALTVAGYALLLRVLRLSERLVQVLTATFGVALVVLPAQILLVMLAPRAAQAVRGLEGFLVMGLLAISIYVLYIQGWILATAIERSNAVSVLLVLVLQVTAFLIAALLLGVRLAAPAAGV